MSFDGETYIKWNAIDRRNNLHECQSHGNEQKNPAS